MQSNCLICNCAGELLALMVATEAMEHNYIWQAEGKIPQSYREPLAEISLGSFRAQVAHKCGVDTSKILELTQEAYTFADKARKRKRSETFDIRADYRHSARQMSEIKGKILDIVDELCEKNPDSKEEKGE